MIYYMLNHKRNINGRIEDKHIGIYSCEESAKKAMERLKFTDEYYRQPEGFYIKKTFRLKKPKLSDEPSQQPCIPNNQNFVQPIQQKREFEELIILNDGSVVDYSDYFMLESVYSNDRTKHYTFFKNDHGHYTFNFYDDSAYCRDVTPKESGSVLLFHSKEEAFEALKNEPFYKMYFEEQ